jgi:hypothetical protein
MNALASMFDSPEFTRQMREAAEKLPRRLLLKSVTETVSSDDKGREQRSTSTMEITELSRGAVPASAFEVPAGYRRVEAPAAALAGASRQRGGEGSSARPGDTTSLGDAVKQGATEGARDASRDAVRGAIGGLLKRKKP